MEKDVLVQEKSKFMVMENDYEELKVDLNKPFKINLSFFFWCFQRKLETTKMDYTRGMKALQIDYENKLQLIQVEKSYFSFISIILHFILVTIN